MQNNPDNPQVFTRYDLMLEATKKKTRRISDDELLQKVADFVIMGDEKELETVVLQVLAKREPLDVINKGLLPGMKEVGRLWEEGIYFLPQVIISSDAMLAGIALCEQKLGQPVKKKGKVVTHTAEGDIHDIGQVIVNALLSAAGFEVINLGADVPVDTVVEACRVHKPIMLSGTALMTTTMTAFPRIAAKLKEEGISIPFVCGGGAVSEEFVQGYDFGIWGKEAGMAPRIAEDALNGLSWQEIRARWSH